MRFLSPELVRSCTREVSVTRLPEHELKENAKRHANVDRGKPRRPPPFTENYRQVMLRAGEVVFLVEEHPIGPPIPNHQNTHTSNIQTEQVVVMSLGIYMYMHIHVNN